MSDMRRVSSLTTSTPRNQFSPDKLHDFVGIENSRTADLHRRNMEQRRFHTEAVLNQAAQGSCHEELARTSETHSRWARERAHKIAAGYWEAFWSERNMNI